jgi:hypothetical protein
MAAEAWSFDKVTHQPEEIAMTQQIRNLGNVIHILTSDELDAVAGGAKSLHNEFSIGGYNMTIDADAVHYTVVVTEK